VRRERAETGTSTVKAVTITDNMSIQLAGTTSSDSRTGSAENRSSRLAARVSREGFGGETTASGTDANVDNTSHHQELSSPKDRQQTNEVDHGEERRRAKTVLCSRQLTKSVWNNVDENVGNMKSARKKRRSRNRNVSASTQTTGIHNLPELGHSAPNSREGRKTYKDGGNDEVDYGNLADMIMSLAAPILASELRAALVESKHMASHDHDRRHRRHHHHQQQQPFHQQDEYRSPWQQTADIMAHPPVVKIVSYQSNQASHRLSVHGRSSSRCPRCCSDRRRPQSDAQRMTPEERTALERLLTEMCRYCDRDCAPGETASSGLKAKLKQICTVLAKHFHR